MKWLEFTDLHLNHRDTNGYEEKGLNFRFKDKIDILKYIVSMALKIKPDFVVNLGDTFEISRVSSRYRAMYFNTIQPLIINKIPIYTMIGNHDRNALEHVFQSEEKALANSEYNHIVSDIITLEYKDCSFVFVPYMQREDAFKEAVLKVKAIASNVPVIVFCHEELQGMKLDNGISIQSRSEINIKDLFGENRYWRFGHYHTPKELKGITFIGNSSRLNFTEEGRKFSFRECSFDVFGFKDKVHEYTDRPFVTKRINVNDKEELAWSKSAVVRLIVSGKKEELLNFSTENLPECKYLRTQYEYVTEDQNEILVNEDSSIEDILKHLCEDDEMRFDYCKTLLKGAEECIS